ncbi:hypothetical protein CGLAU_01785 [Corynebacterium glaucum]|uniref:Uncharacterized protein n=1 Tax=Corynebacterium glaucum TaxID=187491 RepID=A0A1Q2HU22_9CORY|nr:hypothetical protein [Corynebacterium glaucum]AQQ14344.1 hypothetical protein CGLAU_01785 [Corynebacterium glaucum]WJZ06874.1 hypothetical protein CGLAUT_01840 [Corynebacterium glaucum]
MTARNIDPLERRQIDSTGENGAAASSLLYEAIRKVRPDLVGELAFNVSYTAIFKAEASEEEVAAVDALLRPYAERSFADPRARYITWYLIAIGITDLDVASHIADDMELLQNVPGARRALNDDADLMSKVASPDNIQHIDRVLRLDGEHVRDAQLLILVDMVGKKFFRQAPELQWIKNSHFRGEHPRMDKALDRMGT